MSLARSAGFRLVIAAGAAVALRAAANETARPSANRTVLELQIGSVLAPVYGNNGGVFGMGGVPQGRLFVGGKVGRTIFGLGFELARLGTTSGEGPSSSSSSQTSVLFAPGIRFGLAQSSDEQVEAFGEIDVGIGHVFVNQSGSGNSNTGNYRLGYQAGPGLRFWIHPQFGIGGGVGLRGDHYFFTSGSGSSVGVTSIYTSLHVLGAF